MHNTLPSATLALALGLGLTSASPIAVAPRAGGPSVIDGTGFQLAARPINGDLGALDPANAASNAWVLGLQRMGAGFYAAVVIPRSRDKSQNPTYYFNSTAPDGPQTLNIDIPGVYPLVAGIGSKDQTASEGSSEHAIFFDVANPGDGTSGLFWYFRDPEKIPLLGGGPASHGSWAVCKRQLPLPSGPGEYLLPRYIYDHESVPSDCVSVDWVVLCGDLPALKPGDSWNHDGLRGVKCVAQ